MNVFVQCSHSHNLKPTKREPSVDTLLSMSKNKLLIHVFLFAKLRYIWKPPVIYK